MQLRSWPFAVLALALSACASAPKQTQAFLETQRNIPDTYQVEGVPFIQQTQNFCGPASLAMAMNWTGRAISADELSAQTFTPGKEGTLQADILGASRRNGMLVIPVQGIPALLTELAAGHPVIILQNQAFTWYPKWHYAVAVGYDLKEGELTLHSGPQAYKSVDLRKFEHSWSLAEYWGVVVLPPSKLAVTGDELAHASAGAALEQLGKNVEAELIYRNVIVRWPGSLAALIGLGNTRYSAGDYRSAVRYLREAVRRHPASTTAKHNLATAEAAAVARP